MDPNILSPGHTVEIRTAAYARLYRKVLFAKIAVQLILLCVLFLLGSWTWQQLAVVITVATVWQLLENKAQRTENS